MTLNQKLYRVCISIVVVASVCCWTAVVSGQMLQPATQAVGGSVPEMQVPEMQMPGARVAGTQTAGTDARLNAAYNTATASLAAFRQDDFETYVDLMHEKAIEDALMREKAIEELRQNQQPGNQARAAIEGSGREQMISLAQRGKDTLEQQTAGYDTQIGFPRQIIEVGEMCFAIIPQTVTIRLKSEQSLDRSSYLLGVSANNGRSWKLVDGASGAQKIRELFPDIPAQSLPDDR